MKNTANKMLQAARTVGLKTADKRAEIACRIYFGEPKLPKSMLKQKS